MSHRASTWAWTQSIEPPTKEEQQELGGNIRPATAKLVLVRLADPADEDGRCWPKWATISEETELSRASVSRATQFLRLRGLLTWEKRRREDGSQSSNLYQLLIPSEFAAKGARKKTVDRVQFTGSQRETLSNAGSHSETGGVSVGDPTGSQGETPQGLSVRPLEPSGIEPSLEPSTQPPRAGGVGEISSSEKKPIAGSEEDASVETEPSNLTTQVEPVQDAPRAAPAFEDFWNIYPERDGKKPKQKAARAAWNRLSTDRLAAVMVAVRNYRDACDGGQRAAHAATFLDPDNEYIDDWQTPAEPRAAAKVDPPKTPMEMGRGPVREWTQSPKPPPRTEEERAADEAARKKAFEIARNLKRGVAA